MVAYVHTYVHTYMRRECRSSDTDLNSLTVKNNLQNYNWDHKVITFIYVLGILNEVHYSLGLTTFVIVHCFRVNLYFKQVKVEIILMQFAALSFSFFAWPGIQVHFNEHKQTISLSFLDLSTIDAHAVFKVKLIEIDWLTNIHTHTHTVRKSEEKVGPLQLGGRLCHTFVASTIAMTDLNGLHNLMAILAKLGFYSF